MRPLLPTALLLLALLAGCAAPAPAAYQPAESCGERVSVQAPANPQVTLDTSEGALVVEVFRNEVPLTANNFLTLTRSGFYNHTFFHRVIAGFMMQGGDPNSKDSDAANDGLGGPGYKIADEFHYRLRHDGKGVLSMANSGPNSGGSQFFVTFTATPHLDDKHAVFGKIVGGLDVLDRINREVAGGNDGKPKRALELRGATIAEQAASSGALQLCLSSPDPVHAAPGGRTGFLVVAENKGDRPAAVTVTATPPAGQTAAIELGFGLFNLPAGQRVAFTVQANGTGNLPITLSGQGTSATLPLTVQAGDAAPRAVRLGDAVKGNYIGFTVDGRLFDTSVESVAKAVDADGLGYGAFQVRPSYSPFSFKPGSGVIQGFTDLAVGAAEGGKFAGRIPPEKAYGTSGSGALAGRTLLFQLEVVDVT